MADAPLLHHDLIAGTSGEDGPERRVAFFHGIYGSGRNWNSVARRVVRERPEWGAVMVDLREHGESTGFEPPHTIEAAARDVLRTAAADDFAGAALVGHSFGGKVALEVLRLAAEGEAPVPPRVWVVDSTPEAREPSGSAWGVLDRLRRHPGPFRDREAGVHALEEDGLPGPVARWLAINLEDGGDGAFRWRLDVDVMEALLRDFFARDLWEVVESPPEGTEVHLLRATDSSVLSGGSLERARDAAEGSGRVFLHDVDGGHWLNADNPDRLVELIAGGLPG